MPSDPLPILLIRVPFEYKAGRPRALRLDPTCRAIQLAALRTTVWTDLAAGQYFRRMIRKRAVFDPLEPTNESRWYEVRDMRGLVLESRLLPGGTGLRRAFVVAMLEHIDAGWQLGEFSSRGGSFFCTRGGERCQVGIEAADPGRPIGYGASHLTDSPARDG